MPTDMTYLGKLTFKTSTTPAAEYITLDPATATLKPTQSETITKNQKFNAYGDLYTCFRLQALSGKFISVNDEGTGYTALKDNAEDTACFFITDEEEGQKTITDIKDGQAYCWNVQNGLLTRTAKTEDVPDSEKFSIIYASPGTKAIQASGQAMGADLSFAYLKGVDFTAVNFSGADLSNANLCNALLDSAIFQGSATNLTSVLLSGASLNSAALTTTTMPGADLTGAKLTNANLSDTDLKGAVLDGADLSGTNMVNVHMEQASLIGTLMNYAMMVNAHFDCADLSNSDMTYAMTNNMSLLGATLVGANLSGLDLTTVLINSCTVFTGARMQKANLKNKILTEVTFTYADLNGANLSGVDLTGAEMSYVNLSSANLTNGTKLFMASLSNAIMKGADLTGAQLGACQTLFSLDLSPDTHLCLKGLPFDVKKVFQQHCLGISGDTAVEVHTPGEKWIVRDEDDLYFIRKKGLTYNVSKYEGSGYAAVLTGAYMPDAVFTDANLYGVNMSGVNWYGSAARADNADLEEVNFSNANLTTMNFTQARLNGCDFDFAYLLNAGFRGAVLRPSANMRQVSFSFSNIQGADFTQAVIAGTVFTNGAVSLNEGPYFGLPEAFVTDLDNCLVSEALRKEFANNGYPLEPGAIITVNILGKSWTIANGVSLIYKTYNIIKAFNSVTVYGGPVGVHLFNLPSSYRDELNNKIISNNLRETFREKGFPLIEQAAIDKVIITDQKWHMNNFVEGSQTIQKGYVEFYIINKGSFLGVYGSVLMAVRTGDGGTMEQVRVSLSTTKLDPDTMNDDTTCPNGQKIKAYKAGKSESITWEQMMTAAAPPKPPKCIPDPWHWCGE